MASQPASKGPALTNRPASNKRIFRLPVKKIHDGEDVQTWLTTRAYVDIMTFLPQLNIAMFPVDGASSTTPGPSRTVSATEITSLSVLSLQVLIRKVESYIKEAPPDPGPTRFGNKSFRTWYGLVESRLPDLLSEHLPQSVIDLEEDSDSEVSAATELKSYLLGSFGSSERLDYGTGHELSFLAFIGGIWKLGGFPSSEARSEERQIVLGLIAPYFNCS